MARNYKQGYYTLKFPEKYLGDPSKVVYRSSWEFELHRFFDNNTRVLAWSSEEIAIPYVKPTDGRIHRYYPDYYIEYIDRNGVIRKEIIELKPIAQTRQPRSNSKHALYEQATFAVNKAKWQAALVYCKSRGIEFRIATEKSVFK